MVDDARLSEEIADVAVVGAGLNGLAAAKAFALAGFSVLSCGPPERAGAGRTVALFGPSLELMSSFGLIDAVRTRGAALRGLRIVDDTGSLFAPRPVEFRCEELGLDAFGWNIENGALADLVAGSLLDEPNVKREQALVKRLAWETEKATLRGEAGSTFGARLVVAADGRNSPTRKAASIETRTHAYGQSALTLFVRHSRPHDDVSTEFHTRHGPFTLVPLPATPSAADRSSLVWLMSEAEGRRRASLGDADLAREIERQSRGLVGRVEIEGSRSLFPMTRQNTVRLHGRRVALIGDAAHVYPPIGAQGLNLGLRDVQALVAITSAARGRGEDFGGPQTLAAYQRARAPDIAIRSLVVNGLNMALLARLGPVDVLRGFGLVALRSITPLRKRVMREGVAPTLAGL
jgi:2-octaprenyl-6-methoxyphenol hydroxylase